MNILIIGASGVCGSALLPLDGFKVLYDLKDPHYKTQGSKFIKGNLNDIKSLEEAMLNCEVVIHLGGVSDPDSTWEDVLKNNIIGTHNVLEVAHKLKIPKVIFSSSNRVFEKYEIENAPNIYDLDFQLQLNKDSPVRPVSYYGISKVCGETIGRTMAETGGPKFYILRIGSVLAEEVDHPYCYAEAGVINGLWERNSKKYKILENRLKSTWMSRRDFLQMIKLCINYNGSEFDIFFGTSDNPRSWFDLNYAKNILGYKPKDNAENFTQVPS